MPKTMKTLQDNGKQVTTISDLDLFLVGKSPFGVNDDAVIAWSDIKALMNSSNTSVQGLPITWNSTTSITIGTGLCYAQNGDRIDVTNTITKSGLTLSNNTWYHVYLYLDSGTPAAEVVTTAPVLWKGTAYSKTGDTSRRYVFSLRSGASANALAFTHMGNTVMYSEDEPTILRVLTGGSATTETDLSLSTRIPVTSQLAYLTLVNASGSGQVLYTGASGSDNVAPPTTGIVTVSAGTNKAVLHPTDSSQNVSYALSAVSGSINVNCTGYMFQR